MRRAVEIVVLLLAAVLEVGGDAMIRAGLRARTTALILLGAVTLASYGVVLNLLPLDFSKLLGTYVAFFALASVSFGAVVFGEPLPSSTWLGLALILVGSAIMQWGPRLVKP